MAKKIDFKLGDFNSDPNLSLPDLDFDLPDSKIKGRSPVSRVGTGIKKGIKSKLTDETFIRNAVKNTLPKGFGAAYDLGQDVKSAYNNLYNTVAQDLKPYIKDIKRTGQKLVPEVERVAGKKWADVVKKFTKDDDSFTYRTMSAQEYREQNNQREIAEIFAMGQEAQSARDEEAAVREQIRDGMEQRRHSDSLAQLNAMRLGIAQLVNYQSKVTYKYQQKMLEINFRMLGVAQDTLATNTEYHRESIRRFDAIVQNTSLPEFAKLKNSERLQEAMRSNIIGGLSEGIIGNRNQYARELGERLNKKVKQQISNLGFSLQMGLMGADMRLDNRQMARDFGQSSDGYQSAGEMAGRVVPSAMLYALGRRARSRLSKVRGVGRVSNQLQYYSENYKQIMNDWARGDSGERGWITDPLVQGLKRTIREGQPSRSVTVDNINNLQNPMPFNRAANKSIVEIIPGFLSSIDQSLRIIRTGNPNEPKNVYDYSKNRFAPEKEARANTLNRVINKRDRESVGRDIDSLIDKIDPTKSLSKDARIQLGRQLLRDNLNNRTADPRSLQQARRYTGDARQYSAEYSRLFGEYFKGDRSAERKVEFAQAYGGLGRYIQTGKSTVQDMVNLGLGDMLTKSGILSDDSRGNIDMNRLHQFYYGDVDEEGDGSSSSSAVNQMNAANRSTGSSRGDSGSIVNAIRETSVASTQAIVDAINNLQGMLMNGVKTFEAGPAMQMAAQTAQAIQQVTAPAAAAAGGGSSGGGIPGMPKFDMPNIPGMGGFAAGAQDAATSVGDYFKSTVGKGKDAFRSVKKKKGIFGRLGSLGMGAFRGGRKLSNGIVDQAFSNAWKIFKPAAKLGIKGSILGGRLALPRIPGAINMARNFSNGVVNDVQGALGKVFGAGKSTFDSVMGQDVFNSKTGKKVLSAASLRTGQFISSVTGKIIKRPEDIDGPVIGPNGKEVISQKDIDAGLMDASGKPLRSALNRLATGAFSATGMVASAGMKAARFLTSGVEEGLGNAASLAKNTVGRLFRGRGVGSGSAVEVLIQIRDMLNDRLRGKRTMFDDDGIRIGSYEDIKKKRKAKEDEKKAEADKKNAGAGGLGLIGGLLSKLFGRKSDAKAEESKDGDINIIGGGGGDGKGKPGAKKPPPKGFWGKAKSFGGKALSGIGSLAGGALSLLGVPGSIIAGAGSVLGGIGSLATGALGLAGSAIGGLVSLVGLPAILGIAGVGAAGYGLYKLFSGGLKMNPVTKMRYAQYGFLPDEQSKLEAIFSMESKLSKALSFEGGIPELKADKLNLTEIVKAFGVDAENEEQVRRWAAWFQRRFKPVYLTSVGVLKRVAGKVDLTEADSLESDKKARYIDGASFPGGPYDFKTSPFPDGEPLKADASTVAQFVKEAKESIKGVTKDAEGKNNMTAAAGAAATVATAGSIADQTREALKDKQADRKNKFVERAFPGMSIDAAAVAAAGSGSSLVAVAGTLPPSVADTGRVSALKAIRYKAYGLKEMDFDKVSALAGLEREMAKNCVSAGKETVKWEGSPTQVARQFAAAFGVTSDDVDDMIAWTKWFNNRFLPVLTTYLSYLKKTTGKETIEMAEPMLKPIQAYEAGVVIQTAKTVYGDDSVSIWQVTASPWPGYSINTDSKSIQSNLDWLKEKSKQAVLDEAKANETNTTQKSATEKEEQKSWWSRLWGSSDKKDSKVLDPNNPKAGDAPGFSSNEGAAAFGYGRKSHIQTSPGSQNVPVSLGGSGVPLTGGAIDPNDTRSAARIIRDQQDRARQQRLMDEYNSSKGGTGVISGGSAAGSISEGTGGAWQELSDPNGEGTAASMSALIADAAKKTGTPFDMMMTMAAIESGFRPSIKAPTSSATGLYQFIKSTWDTTLKKYGSKYGIPMDTPPTNPKANALMGGEFLKENMRALQSVVKNREITDTDLYIAHFLGAGGAKQLLGADPNAIAATLMPAPARANKSIFFQGERPRTVAEVYQVLNALVQRKGKQFGLNAGGGAGVSTAKDSYTKPQAIAGAQDAAGGGYAGSVAPVEQTPGAVGATGVVNTPSATPSGSAPTTGSNGSIATPTSDPTSRNELAATQSYAASRQQDLSLQQAANGQNTAASMTALESNSKQLVVLGTQSVALLQAILDAVTQSGVSGATGGSNTNRAPSNANATAKAEMSANAFPRPSDTSPINMKRRFG